MPIVIANIDIAGRNLRGRERYQSTGTAGPLWYTAPGGDVPYANGQWLGSDGVAYIDIHNGQTASFRAEMYTTDFTGGGWSNVATATQAGTAAAAGSVSLTDNGDGTATVAWAASASGAQYYVTVVDASQNPVFGGTNAAVAATGSSVITGLIPGSSYHAILQTGVSVPLTGPYGGTTTNYGFAKASVTMSGAPVPDSPSNLVINLVGKLTISMHWVDNSDNEAGFRIYRSSDPTFTTGVTLEGTTGPDVTSFIDVLPDPTTAWYYRVYSFADGAASLPAHGPFALPMDGESQDAAAGVAGGGILTAVQFGGARTEPHGSVPDIQAVARDNLNGDYSTNAPEWLDTNGNGTIDSTAPRFLDGTIDGTTGQDHEWPISYVRSTLTSTAYISASVTVQFPAGITESNKMEVEGTSSGYTFGPAVFQVAPGSHVITVTSSQSLPNFIDFVSLYITWTIGPAGKTPPSAALSVSKTPMFITGGPAKEAYETPLFLGCLGGSGMQPYGPVDVAPIGPGAGFDAEIATAKAIFGQFSGLNTHRVDGELMVYSHAVDNAGNMQFATGAVTNADGPGMLERPDGHGQCTAWAEILVDTFKYQGIGCVSTKIDKANRFDGFAVRAMPAQGSGGKNYFVGVKPDAFNFHQVVRLTLPSGPQNSIIFDPSYGSITTGLDARLIYTIQHIRDLLTTNVAGGFDWRPICTSILGVSVPVNAGYITLVSV